MYVCVCMQEKYAYFCMYIHICECMSAFIHTCSLYINRYVYMGNTYMNMYVYMLSCINEYIHVSMYVGTHMSLYVYVCVHA